MTVMKWPKSSRELFDLLESMIYLPNDYEEHVYRHSVRDNTSPAELARVISSPFVAESLCAPDLGFPMGAPRDGHVWTLGSDPPP